MLKSSTFEMVLNIVTSGPKVKSNKTIAVGLKLANAEKVMFLKVVGEVSSNVNGFSRPTRKKINIFKAIFTRDISTGAPLKFLLNRENIVWNYKKTFLRS